MSTQQKSPKLPPRWFIRGAWTGHRLLYRTTGRGLSRPKADDRAGTLRLRTTGRRTGKERAVMLSYFIDGDAFITLAMNGWAEADPAWWLNIQAHPAAEADTVDGVVKVIGREAVGDERQRLWELFGHYRGWGDVDAYAVRRPCTPVVILTAT